MQKWNSSWYMPDGSTKIFEDIKGVEQQGEEEDDDEPNEGED